MKKVPNAGDIMAKHPITLRADTKIHEAANKLVKKRIGSAPVVDEHGEFLGVFSLQSCLKAMIDAVHGEVPGKDVSVQLDAETDTITEETGLLAIAQQFVQANRIVPSLPVLRDGILVGLVSRHDVILAVSHYLSSATDTHARLLYLSALKDPEETPEFS